MGYYMIYSSFCARQELKLLPDLDEATTIRLTMRPPGNPTDGIAMAYPLVNIQKAIENGHRNSGFTH